MQRFPITYAIVGGCIVIALVIPFILYAVLGGSRSNYADFDLSQCTVCPHSGVASVGRVGFEGPFGPPGEQGDCFFPDPRPPGPKGIDCFDTNGDGFFTQSEDFKNLGLGTVLDYCVGDRGERGDMGQDGLNGTDGRCDNSNICQSGERGPPGRKGRPGARCWDSLGFLDCTDTNCTDDCTCDLYDIGCTCSEDCKCGVGLQEDFTTCLNTLGNLCPDRDNTNSFCNAAFDVNLDLVCDRRDCQGPKGPPGLDANNSTLTGNETNLTIAGTIQFDGMVNVDIGSFLDLPFLNFSSIIFNTLSIMNSFGFDFYNYFLFGTERYIFRGPTEFSNFNLDNETSNVMCIDSPIGYDGNCLPGCPDFSLCVDDNTFSPVKFRDMKIINGNFNLTCVVPVGAECILKLGNETYKIDDVDMRFDVWEAVVITLAQYTSQNNLGLVAREYLNLTSEEIVVIESDRQVHLISNDNPEPRTVGVLFAGKQGGGLNINNPEYAFSRIIFDGNTTGQNWTVTRLPSFTFTGFVDGFLTVQRYTARTLEAGDLLGFGTFEVENMTATTRVETSGALVDVIQPLTASKIISGLLRCQFGSGCTFQTDLISDRVGGIGTINFDGPFTVMAGDIEMQSGQTIQINNFATVIIQDDLTVTGQTSIQTNFISSNALSTVAITNDLTVTLGPCPTCIPSDKRLKQEIEELDPKDCMELVRRMKPKKYEKKFFKSQTKESVDHHFFVAQDLVEDGLLELISKKQLKNLLPKRLAPPVDELLTVDFNAMLTLVQGARLNIEQRIMHLQQKVVERGLGTEYMDILSGMSF